MPTMILCAVDDLMFATKISTAAKSLQREIAFERNPEVSKAIKGAGYVLSPNAVANRDYLTSNKVPTIIANAGANVISRAKKSD